MPDLEAALAAQRKAAEAFKATALAVPESVWKVPRAPGKWSPAQVVDHVGIASHVVVTVMQGRGDVPKIPKFLRWLPRKTYFDPVLRKGFPKKSYTTKAFVPPAEPAPRAALVARLETEIAAVEAEARAMAARGQASFDHTMFGTLAVADYVTFNTLHLDHHRTQLPGAS